MKDKKGKEISSEGSEIWGIFAVKRSLEDLETFKQG
jgi:hypothetical protein